MGNKFVIKYIIFLIFVFSASGCAKQMNKSQNLDKYYYVEVDECELAIPQRFKLRGSFNESSFEFYSSDKKCKLCKEIKNLYRFQDILITDGNSYTEEAIKAKVSSSENILIKEKKIKNLKLLQYRSNSVLGVEHDYYIISKHFIYVYMNGDKKEVDYIIKHCLGKN